MGTGTWSLRSLLNKVDAGEVHLRTHEATGTRWNGYGREYSPDLSAVRGEQNKGGSQPSSEGQETKIQFLGIEEVENTVTFWKGKQMETQNGRNSGPKEYNWRGFLESAQKGMENTASKDGDPILNVHKISNIASSLYDINIKPVDVARIIHCAALMYASQDPSNSEKHRRVIASAATLAELSRAGSEPDMAQLRVVTDLAAQLATQS